MRIVQPAIFASLLVLVLSAAAHAQSTQPADVAGSIENRLNATWVLLASLPVYLMHGGFGFFESGMVRRKNTVTTLVHNLMVLAITAVVFWLCGFAFMYGDGPQWIGLHGFAPSLLLDPDPRFSQFAARPIAMVCVFAFTLAYADTAATLVSGACGERLKLIGFMIITAIVSGLIFPLVGRAVVGGGWLTRLHTPVSDVGAGFVQLSGGCCALVTTAIIGPRKGRFNSKGESQDIPSSSLPLVFLGAFILWFGFLAYNIGFALIISRSAALVLLNSVLGSMAGTITALLMAFMQRGKGSLRAAIIGMLTASVASTSSSGLIEPWASLLVGAVVGALSGLSISFWVRLGIDDPTEYMTMNVVGGIAGMLAVGIFASPAIIQQYGASPVPGPGLIYGGFAQLFSQCIGILTIVAFSSAAIAPVAWTLHKLGQLRISDVEEQIGGDRYTHGESAYDGFAWDQPEPGRPTTQPTES